MGRPSTLTEEQWDALLKEYAESDIFLTDIAAKYGTNAASIVRMAKQRGVIGRRERGRIFCSTCDTKLTPQNRGRDEQCKACVAAVRAAYEKRRPDVQEAAQARWYEKNAVSIRAKRRTYYSTHREQERSRDAERNRRVKAEVLGHYSGGTAHCACCGEYLIEFLTLDHINGLSPEEKIPDPARGYRRKLIGRAFYEKLKREGYPPGFQVLCWNCNCAKRIGIKCPHQIQREEAVEP